MSFPVSPGTITLSWESCPEELLRMIFKQSCLKSLVSCMTVNRRWKATVLDYIEFYSLWPKIVSEAMVNKGRTFQRKSGILFSFKEMLMNSMLWSFVPLAEIELHYTYALQNIIRIQVNKEFLILTADPQKWRNKTIQYNFNIPNTQLTSYVCGTEIDFRENDYMRVVLVNDGRELRAYGKGSPYFDGETNPDLMYEMLNPLLYRLEDNVCYILAKHNVVWALTWNRECKSKEWDLKSRGRYYGNALDTICGINVYNERVCLVTKLGIILCENPETMSYHKVNSNNLVASLKDSTVLELFNQNGVAISVNNSNQRVKVCQDMKSNLIWLECGDMTCATEHGEVLFIGYKDGTVAICTPHTMPARHGQPDRLFNVHDFDRSIEDPSILAVEVFEDKLSQHLLVATRHKVLQFLITYPLHIREYFE